MLNKKLIKILLSTPFVVLIAGFVFSATPEITSINIAPEMNLAHFGSYTVYAEISGAIISGEAILEGINGDGGNCINYYASGGCISTGDNVNLTFSGGNIRRKEYVRPDNIYPQIGFSDDPLYRYNAPEEILINKNSYSIMHFQNPFTMTGDMNFWIEFNAIPESTIVSKNIQIYIMGNGHNISDFNSKRIKKSFVKKIGTKSRSKNFNHTHTANSSHYLFKLPTNADGTITNNNIDINGDFWIILYSARPIDEGKGRKMRYQSGTMCDDYAGRYVGNRVGRTTQRQYGGCPDVHIHLARQETYLDGINAEIEVTYVDGTGTNTITQDTDFYFADIPNLAPNDISFVFPEGDLSYSGNINIERDDSIDPNNDIVKYNIYLLDSTGTIIRTLITGTTLTSQLLDINGLNDGEYKMTGEACDNTLCTSFFMEDPFILDTINPNGDIGYSETGTTSNNVTATLTLDETGIILNNGGSDTYIFTDNGSFTFEFKDSAGNTGETTATVNYIIKSSGGGGSKITKDSCPNGDYSPSYYDKTCGEIKEIDDKDMEKKYLPVSNNYRLHTLKNYIDDLIEIKYPIKIETKNTSIKYRNEFIIILEEFVNKAISSYKAKGYFKDVLGELMPLIK